MRKAVVKKFDKIAAVVFATILALAVSISVVCVSLFSRSGGSENAGGVSADGSVLNAAETVAPESLWKTDVKTTATPNVTAPLSYTMPENGSGVMLTFFASDATATFENPIDVSGNTKSDAFVSFMPVPLNEAVGENGTMDCDEIHFTLTDELDESNFVTVSVSRYFYDCWSQANVYYSGSAYPWLAVDWDRKTKATDGKYRVCQVWKSIPGVLYKGPNGRNSYEAPWTIYYDSVENAIYISSMNNKDFTCQGGGFEQVDRPLVLDLDDPDLVGAGNEWGGFKGKRAKLSITVKRLRSQSAQVLVYGVNGTSLAGNAVNDKKAPSLESDAEEYGEELPFAEVGKPYKIFAPRAFDEIRGDKTGEVTISLTKPDGKVKDVTGEMFLDIESAGEHKLTYSVRDDDGNKAEKEYVFDARICLDDLSVSTEFEPVSTAFVGERVSVPQVTAFGGSERGLKTETSVIHMASMTERTVANGYFTPDVSGDYAIRYSVSDYLGNRRDFDRMISVSRGTKPIAAFVEDEDFIKAFIGGSSIKLPSIEAFDYTTYPAASVAANVKTEYKYDGGEYTETADGTFTPDKSKSSVTVRYTAYIGETPTPERSVSREYKDIAIINPVDAGSYFIKENAESVPLDSSVRFSASDTGLSVARVEFVNAVESASVVQFGIGRGEDGRDVSENNFGFLRVKFSDSEDSRVSVTMDIYKNAPTATKCDLYFRGNKYSVTGSFHYNENFSYPFQIGYKKSDNSFVDFTGARMFAVKTDDTGKAFDGFPSGAVRIKLEMHGITGNSSLYFEMIGNQRFSEASGTAFKDNMQPVITTDFTVPTEADFGSSVVVPSARAYDVLSPSVTCSLRITAPDGSAIYDGDCSEAVSFAADKYGVYNVVYSARDASGNDRSLRRRISVADREKPSLIVSGTLEPVVKVGKEIKVPVPIVHDNLTEQVDMITNIYLVSPTGIMTKVAAGEKVKIGAAGTYKLLYYAADEAGNSALTEYTFTAEGK